jgi:hypothetical protein
MIKMAKEVKSAKYAITLDLRDIATIIQYKVSVGERPKYVSDVVRECVEAVLRHLVRDKDVKPFEFTSEAYRFLQILGISTGNPNYHKAYLKQVAKEDLEAEGFSTGYAHGEKAEFIQKAQELLKEKVKEKEQPDVILGPSFGEVKDVEKKT